MWVLSCWEPGEVCAPRTGWGQLCPQMCCEAVSPRWHLRRMCPVQDWTQVTFPPPQKMRRCHPPRQPGGGHRDLICWTVGAPSQGWKVGGSRRKREEPCGGQERSSNEAHPAVLQAGPQELSSLCLPGEDLTRPPGGTCLSQGAPGRTGAWEPRLHCPSPPTARRRV